MKVLVTGCAGFIGMHVCLRLLARGDEVVGIDNPNGYYDVQLKRGRFEELTALENFSFIKLDITDQVGIGKLFASQGFQRVVSLTVLFA